MTLRWKIAQFFEKLWWKRYLKSKDEKSYLEWKANYWKEFLVKAKIEVQNDDVILDAGCGPAGAFILFDKQEVDAIDPLLDYYTSNISHFKKDAYPNVTFINQKLELINDSEKYTKIFCLNVINHVEDIKVVAQKLSESLSKDGEMYVSIDAHNFSFLKHIFQLLPGDILHPHQYDLDDYKDLFINLGMKVNDAILFDKHFIFNYYLLKISK